MTTDRLTIAGREFKSRLWVGTGKYKDFVETQKAIEVSGAEVVTVAVRRVNITDRSKENLLDYIDPKKYMILPNTAGCYTVEDAVRYARLARAAGVSDRVKLEVLGDEKTLFPDTAGLIEAAKILIKEGFIVLPYTNDDPIVARKLVDIGCPAVMPLAAPIGSGLGIRNPYNLKIIMETVKVPIIVDAGAWADSTCISMRPDSFPRTGSGPAPDIWSGAASRSCLYPVLTFHKGDTLTPGGEDISAPSLH